MTQSALTASLLRDRRPAQPVTVSLPLATLSEVDQRARAGNLTHGQLLYQLIEAALHENARQPPQRSDVERLAEVPSEIAARPRGLRAIRR